MSHWAELDEENIVLRVLVGDNNDPNGDEGYQWLLKNLGGTWVQTSYNATIRNKFANIGDIYNSELDVFIEPKPFESWVLNEDTYLWDPPIPYPEGDDIYRWNEDAGEWSLVSIG